MTKPYIYKRLDQLEQKRLIGKPGLSINEVRDSQVKVRFTENENDLLSLVSAKLGQPKAVISNVLLIDAVIDLLADDPLLYDEVMAAWREQKRPNLDFFSEIDKRSLDKHEREPIEGEFCPIQPHERRIALVVDNAEREGEL